MKRIVLFVLFALGISLPDCGKPENKPQAVNSHNQIIIHHEKSLLSITHPDYQTTRSVTYEGQGPKEGELKGVQCPVPMKDRVNYPAAKDSEICHSNSKQPLTVS
jgi:hypothetical protein